jgi:argininosuccinate lyase
MTKLWQGRTSGEVDPSVDQLNRSIAFDQRLYPYDIQGSIAHAQMLGHQSIISVEEANKLVQGLQAIQLDIDNGHLEIDPTAEDIHTFIELELTNRLGDVGKKLHTGRSRNDQVALDLRLYTRNQLNRTHHLIEALQNALETQAEQNQTTVMPGYTHLQPAQPITFGMHLNAYIAMLDRDKSRIQDCLKRMNFSPLGAGALAGSTFPLDRAMVADALGFDGILENSLDAVSSRDFAIEALSGFSILMTHLSRFAEEIILWNTQEFGFITLDNAHTTGSSMMPQKKNPDVAELVRGKTGRVYGSLITLLTVMKALPLAYNKDMQEDKEALFDAVDTVQLCLQALTSTVQGLRANSANMLSAAQRGFINATDLADYLVKKGLPFREAYSIVGQVVAHCVDTGSNLENLQLNDYQNFSNKFEEDLYGFISLQACVAARSKNF